VNVLGSFIPIVPVSGWLVVAGLLVLFFRLLVNETLVTRRVVDDLRAQRDEWRKTAEKLAENNQMLASQVARMSALSETSAHVLTSLPVVEGEVKDA